MSSTVPFKGKQSEGKRVEGEWGLSFINSHEARGVSNRFIQNFKQERKFYQNVNIYS